MTEDQLSSFIAAAKADPALMERLDGTEDIASVVAIAKDAGFTISADALKSKAGVGDLSDEELEATCCSSTGTVISGVSLCVGC